MNYRCKGCHTKLVLWTRYCPVCNSAGTVTAYVGDAPRVDTGLWIRASEVKEETVKRIGSGMSAVDDVFGGGLAIPSVILMGGNPGIGKCLAGSTVVTMSDGSLVPMSASPLGETLSFESWSGKVRYHEAQAWIPSGVKPVFLLETSTDRRIEATSNHPFLTPYGWRSLESLKTGDYVAIARFTPSCGDRDGQGTEAVVAHIASSVDISRYRTDAIERMVNDSGHDPQRILEQYTADGRIDLSPVARWSRSSLYLFFKALFSSASLSKSGGSKTFRIRHKSDYHLRQISTMLLRYGIVSRVTCDKQYHCLCMSDASSLRLAATTFNPENQFFLEAAIAAGSETYEGKKDVVFVTADEWRSVFEQAGTNAYRMSTKYGISFYGSDKYSRSKIQAMADDLDSDLLRSKCEAEIFWDKIVRINPSGEKETYDLSVPSTSNFVANDFIVHNSTLLLGIVGANAKDALYVTSEEPAQSIAIRAQRLGLRNVEDIRITSTISVEKATMVIKASRAKIVIVDSLQGLRNISAKAEEDFLKAKSDGKVTKTFRHTMNSVRDMALDLIQTAMKTSVAMVLVNHMNKGGDLSGVKEIEHMVDVASLFTGDANSFIRELRCRKNRYGGTAGKVAKLLMTKRGILEATEEHMEIYGVPESDRKQIAHTPSPTDKGAKPTRSGMS